MSDVLSLARAEPLKVGDIVVDWDGDTAEVLKVYRAGDGEDRAVLFYANGAGDAVIPFSSDALVRDLKLAA